MQIIIQRPLSSQDYQRQVWEERARNGELEAALAGKLPSAKDWEALKNCKPGVPELNYEFADRLWSE